MGNYLLMKNHILSLLTNSTAAQDISGGLLILPNYPLRLNTTVSEKIALPAINPTAAMTGRLIVAPAMPVDIPISIDKPKVNTITTKAYQPG